jgi:hypothetical protein
MRTHTILRPWRRDCSSSAPSVQVYQTDVTLLEMHIVRWLVLETFRRLHPCISDRVLMMPLLYGN